MSDKPDYTLYSYSELLEAKAHLDKEVYPDRYNEIMILLRASEYQKMGEVSKYSTFWPRLFAVTIDGVIFSIVLYVECLLLGISYNPQDKFLQAVNGIQFSIYLILMHGFFGQTVGKMIVGVKVVNHANEAKINVIQSLRRESVGLVLNVSWFILILAIVISFEISGVVSENLLYTIFWFGLLAIAWGVSEFITMLFNDKRRAVHDYIGKTVVVRT